MNKAKFYTMLRNDQPGCNHSYFSCTCSYKPVLVDGYNIDGIWGTYRVDDTWRLINYSTGLQVGNSCCTRKAVEELYKRVKNTRMLEKHIEKYPDDFQEHVDTFNTLLAEMGVQQYTQK